MCYVFATPLVFTPVKIEAATPPVSTVPTNKMATIWLNFPQNDNGRGQKALMASFPAKQPDVDFLVPVSSRFTGVRYAKELFTMLKSSSPELQKQFVWEPLKGRGGSGESDILNTDSKGYLRDYPLWRDDFGLPVADGNGYFVLAQIRTDEFWLNICLGDQYFTPFQKVQEFPVDELIYSKIARIHRDDAKELFCTLSLAAAWKDLSAFQKLIHVGMGIGEAEREEPYCFLEPTLTVKELDAQLEAYMAQ